MKVRSDLSSHASLMEFGVETLKCKSCGTSMDVGGNSVALRCTRCGTLAEEFYSSATAHSLKRASSLEETQWLRSLLVRIYCRVALVLILYVLSTGPMYWAVYEAFNASGSSFLAKLYFPIAFACQQSETICNWFDWYVGLWVY